jgi:SAM-dependent methyltransferase
MAEETYYDVVAYPPGSYRQSHPDRLAALATLLGMDVAPVGACRVLEVGCGDGSNLIPMAVGLPGSEFVGVDLAAAPIARGNAVIAAAGLGNVRLEALDLMAFPEDAGTFDYIVAHGFCSWVPDVVRKKLWAVIDRHLAPNGVAYASYNAYPAAHLRNAVRDMMTFHAAQLGTPSTERARVGRDFLGAVGGVAKGPDVWKQVLTFELERLGKQRLDVISHDEMGAFYNSFRFAEIVAESGLQYVAESSLRRLLAPLDAELTKAVDGFGATDLVAREQYLDFLEFRSFRETVFCRKQVPLDRDGVRGRVRNMYLASPLENDGPGAGGATKFRDRQTGGVIQTNHPDVVRILKQLGACWPSAVAFAELPDAVEPICQLVAAGLVELRTHPLVPPRVMGRMPVASPLARVQLASGARTTNLLHTMVEMNSAEAREVVCLLDGRASKGALTKACAGIQGGVDGVLELLYRHGLLMG